VAGADRLALAAAGITVVLWASAFVAIRGAGRDFSPGALALGRLVCGVLVLGLVSLLRREGWPPRAAWPGIVAAGLLWFGVYMVALNWGEQKVDAGTAAMVVNIGPVVIALLSGLLLKEGFPRSLLLGMAVSFAGVVVVGIATSGGGGASTTGILLCLLAALSYSIAVVCQKPALRHASALQLTTFGAAVGMAACLPFSGQLVTQTASAPLTATLSVVYLGVFPTALAFTTWGYALARTTAGKMGATTYLAPPSPSCCRGRSSARYRAGWRSAAARCAWWGSRSRAGARGHRPARHRPSSRARRLAALAVSRPSAQPLAEHLDEGLAEGRQVIGPAAGHQHVRAVCARDDFLVEPGRARVPQIGLQAGPRRQSAVAHHVRLDQRPRPVADHRHRPARREEAARELDRVCVHPQLVGVGHATGQDEPGVVVLVSVADVHVDVHDVAAVEVVEQLDLVLCR
jgi:drug/metabolite transporter (DMT)-like permease